MSNPPPPLYPDRITDLRSIAFPFSLQTRQLAEIVLSDPAFALCTGSVGAGKHHAGDGGLQQHTWEVVKLCLSSREIVLGYKPDHDIDKETLFLAALYHDMGKCLDYLPGVTYNGHHHNGWYSTPHSRTINHINRSAIEWSRAARGVVSIDMENEVLHAILAHHGDYGSSLLPKSRVAWILHTCDQMSARMNDADTLDLSKR